MLCLVLAHLSFHSCVTAVFALLRLHVLILSVTVLIFVRSVTLSLNSHILFFFFFLNDTAPTEIYPLPLPDALPICQDGARLGVESEARVGVADGADGPPHDVGDVHVGGGGDLAAHDRHAGGDEGLARDARRGRSEEHTSELQSLAYLVCRLLLEKKK